jgi:hypothetical protein
MCENNQETNFITEKIWESLLCETLCFYWGCPNLSDYIHPLAYIELDMNDFEKSFQIMKNAIENNEWEKRLPIIREEKKKVLNCYNFYPTLSRVIHSIREMDIYEKEIQPYMKNYELNKNILKERKNESKKVCFLHSCHVQHIGTDIRDSLIEQVIEGVDILFIIEYGEYKLVEHPKVMYIYYGRDIDKYEIPTLKCLHTFSCHHPNWNVLYIHTKGVSYHPETLLYNNMKKWRDYMMEHLLFEVEPLGNYETSGCNYLDAPYPHYSGNFWWASTNYIRRLSIASLINKHDSEWWILSDNPNKKIIANSNINYYEQF